MTTKSNGQNAGTMTILTEEQVKGLSYQNLMKYASEIGVKYDFQKKPELLELVLAKQSGSPAPAPAKASVNPIAKDYKEYPVYELSKDKTLRRGDIVKVDPALAVTVIGNNAQLLEKLRDMLKEGQGYLIVSDGSVKGSHASLVAHSLKKSSESIILAEKCLVKVVPPADDVEEYVSEVEEIVEASAKEEAPLVVAVDMWNEDNPDEAITIVGKVKDGNVTIECMEVKVVVSEKALMTAMKKSTVYDLVTSSKMTKAPAKKEAPAKKASAKKAVVVDEDPDMPPVVDEEEDEAPVVKKESKKAPAKLKEAPAPVKAVKATTEKKAIELNAKRKGILDNEKYTKSDKIRKLYQDAMTVAEITNVLGIHYSFTYCVVDKFRKSFPDAIPTKK